MTVCNTEIYEFARCKRRKVQAQFSGGDITSDGGVMLLKLADKRMDLTRRVAKKFSDSRDQGKCTHRLLHMLRQRVYALALGYEDLNDHSALRKDKGIQTAVGKDTDLASSATLCRFENASTPQTMWAISNLLVDAFIESFDKAPKELILDFDCTDDAVHGKQVGAFFHGYYDHYCFLPLYVFCGQKLLVSYLRPGNIDSARQAWAVLSLLVKRFRQVWPQVRIIFRGDSGFCRHRMFTWCERNNVQYIVGLAKNNRLKEQGAALIRRAEKIYKETGLKQRLFDELFYAAETWSRRRRVIFKAEHSSMGSNPRYLVTNMDGDPRQLYDQLYCARGEAENRIKEQLYLFADRTSCMNWLPNQLRLLLSSLAYSLLETIRSLGLSGTQFSKARCDTLRLRLLKIGAVIIRNSRRVRFLMSSSYPLQNLFLTVAKRLSIA